MKTLIGYHLHTPENTGVRPRRVFLGTPVHIPPPRRRMDECRVIAPPIPLAPSTRTQQLAFIVVAYIIALGTAATVWL